MKPTLILPLLIGSACLVLSPALQAQDASPAPTTTGTGAQAEAPEGRHHPGGGHPGDMLQRLTTELNLTADQQAQIKPILEATHKQMQATREDTSLTKEEKMAKAKEAWEASNSQINGLLTPAQQQQFAALKEKMHNRRHGGAAEGQPSPAVSPVASPTP